MPGNTIKYESCDDEDIVGTITKKRYKAMASLYYTSIDYFKEYYKNTKSFMISHFPQTASYTTNDNVVPSTTSARCKKGKISAWKSYYSGETFKSIMDTSKITYIDMLAKYMAPKDLRKHTMKWLDGKEELYTTEDGTHMDEATTPRFTAELFNEVLKKSL